MSAPARLLALRLQGFKSFAEKTIGARQGKRSNTFPLAGSIVSSPPLAGSLLPPAKTSRQALPWSLATTGDA